MTEHHGRPGARRRYKEPQRRFANQVIKIKLFCCQRGCNNYTIGIEGYNGGFTDEDGTMADLRNQSWYCDKHSKKARDANGR